MKLIGILAAASLVNACSVSVIREGQAASTRTIDTSFDPAQVAWSKAVGTASIQGSAALRTQGGDVKSCGGLPIYLVPDSDYARKRMDAIYGSLDKGVATSASLPTADPRYEDSLLEASCDAQGNFQFEKVAPGTYYATVTITWAVPTYTQIGHSYVDRRTGASLMRRVVIGAGETRHIVLAP